MKECCLEKKDNLADPGWKEMGVHLLTTFGGRPGHLAPIISSKPGSIGGQFDPRPPAILSDQAHVPITFKGSTDLPTPFLCGVTDLLTVIPAIDQDMRLSAWDGFEVLDLFHRHPNLALERLLFLLTDILLAIHPGLQRTTLTQKNI